MTILLFLIAGVALGFLLRGREKAIVAADKVTTWSIYLLIFLLGVSVGINETVMNALGQLGLQALVLSSGAVAGSVLLSYLVYLGIFKAATEQSRSDGRP